ncbi:MAG: LPS export ABC transporter periplasmic protein LptC [Bacteroidota bacterium]|nr:LPS export ABC transporter periplasmic protein LptC [Bacteroidota bacterium]
MRNILFCLVWVLCACKKNDLKQVENITSKTVPAERSTDVEAIYSDSAEVKARMMAPVMIRYLGDNPTVEMKKGLKVEFYSDSLTINSSLKSDYAIRYVNKGITKLTGNVVVVNIQGDTLNTEELYWDEPKERVYSEKFVKVKTRDKIFLAEGFESNVEFTKYTFYKLKGIITVKE